MALVTETNQQYYAGAQGFTVQNAAGENSFTFTFNTNLILGSSDPNNINYQKNNFKLYHSVDGLTYSEIVGAPYGPFTLSGNTITLASNVPQGEVIVCQLKRLDGGSYGDRTAYGTTVEKNYGSYAYVTLNNIINNFIVAYVGQGKLIPSVKRTDLILFNVS